MVVFTTTDCIEELETTSFTYEKLLVVDANISDQVKAHEVRLTYTSPVDGDAGDLLNTVSGAAVWIEDDLGMRVDFTEQSAGFYFSPDTFAGVSGRSYALFITTNEGKRYQSSFEKLVQAPEISEIYNRFAVESTDQKGGATPGVQFFIDVKDADQSTQFYRYEWTDAHQIMVPYIKKYEATTYYVGLAMFYRITPFNEDVQECYRENRFNELILANSATNINGELNEVPISFSPATDFDVTTMYSIEVTQRAISAQAYSYYRKIKLFNESNGSLFDKQQGIIVGNIISIDSPDEQVLGYFEVAGASSKRVFLDSSELDPEVYKYVTRPCEKYPSIEFDGSLNTFYEATDLPEEQRGGAIPIRELYELYDIYETDTGPVLILAHRFCADCRRRGGLEKPTWWQ
ncbi:hypothetical protein AWN68_06560 [Roseivirga echinicomitans]|uniref:DUF4249 domain-containing protein n=1 Tax=Roseivirga echinicomitans TaxID=296218 RepID=A0A150XD93_9BACT|nr:hypothetical protein AWN68_06560 [Roseivirga echinicomitans]